MTTKTLKIYLDYESILAGDPTNGMYPVSNEQVAYGLVGATTGDSVKFKNDTNKNDEWSIKLKGSKSVAVELDVINAGQDIVRVTASVTYSPVTGHANKVGVSFPVGKTALTITVTLANNAVLQWDPEIIINT